MATKVDISDESKAAIALEVHRELPALEDELKQVKGDKETAALIREQIAVRKQYLAEVEAAAIADAKAELAQREADAGADTADAGVAADTDGGSDADAKADAAGAAKADA